MRHLLGTIGSTLVAGHCTSVAASRSALVATLQSCSQITSFIKTSPGSGTRPSTLPGLVGLAFVSPFPTHIAIRLKTGQLRWLETV